ncbi:MAG: hypothetical protein LBC97_07990 [Bifidobacteriaceae bacterium]|jgi:hypothetical protein|nr:hypothetical protein [Bifidobacteriaceae bacterium]
MVYVHVDKPPGHLIAALGLPRGAKVLAVAALPDAVTWLIAANLGLGVASTEAQEFHPWDQIERAKMRPADGVLTVTYSDTRRTVEYTLRSKDKRFASIVNERVKASVVEVEHVPVDGGQVIVALRRRPTDQSVYLQELPGPGVDPAVAEPLVRAARARLGEAAGLPSGTW